MTERPQWLSRLSVPSLSRSRRFPQPFPLKLSCDGRFAISVIPAQARIQS